MNYREKRIRGLLAHNELLVRERMDKAYRNNPSFYHAVNVIEGALPIFMEALLKSSEQQERSVALLVELDKMHRHPLRAVPEDLK